MTKHTLVAGLLAAALAGCTATAAGSIQAGAGASGAGAGAAGGTAAGGSTSPGAGAGAGANLGTGAATGAAAGTANATMAAIFKQGRRWVYEMDMGGLKTEYTEEVVKVEGARATLKTTATVAGQPQSSERVQDLATADFTAVVTSSFNRGGATTDYTWSQSATTQESVTVPAGAYNCTKYAGKLVAKQGAKPASGLTEIAVSYWIDNGVGLVKQEGAGKLNVSMGYRLEQLPGGMQLPPGVTMPGGGTTPTIPAVNTDFKFNLVLKSVTP